MYYQRVKLSIPAIVLLAAIAAAQTVPVSLQPGATGEAIIVVGGSAVVNPVALQFAVTAPADLTLSGIHPLVAGDTYSTCAQKSGRTACVILPGIPLVPVPAGAALRISYTASAVFSCRPVVKLSEVMGVAYDGTRVPMSFDGSAVRLRWSDPADLNGDGAVDQADLLAAVQKVVSATGSDAVLQSLRQLVAVAAAINAPAPDCPLP